MNARFRLRGQSWTCRERGTVLALLLFGMLILSPLRGAQPEKADPTKDQAGFFYPITGARDCAFDSSRQRLYVTTPRQLVVVDTKARKIVDSIDLPGGIQGCDIAPDFSFLAIAPIQAQYLYRIKLDWEKVEDMDISQVKFKANPTETGVYSLAVGFDNSVLFSMTYAGSGWVVLRRLNPKGDSVEEVGRVRMDSVITASGDRRYAAVAEGNISSGPLNIYDFGGQQLQNVANLQCFHYEIACSRDGKHFARPHRNGCDLYDAGGGRLGNLEGKPVICAAFHPKYDSLFVMRHGELNIQEYDIHGKNISNDYPLDKPLVIRGDVRETVIANLHPVGPDMVMANFRRVVNVNFRTYQSGRLKVSENGETLCAVIPSGVYLFPIKPRAAADADPKGRPRIKVIETDR